MNNEDFMELQEKRKGQWREKGEELYEAETVHGNTMMTSYQASDRCFEVIEQIFGEHDGLVNERLWLLSGWMSAWVSVHPSFEA